MRRVTRNHTGNKMKKTYEKPAFVKAALLQQVAAASVTISGIPVPPVT
jgi:hypothetical protein